MNPAKNPAQPNEAKTDAAAPDALVLNKETLKDLEPVDAEKLKGGGVKASYNCPQASSIAATR